MVRKLPQARLWLASVFATLCMPLPAPAQTRLAPMPIEGRVGSHFVSGHVSLDGAEVRAALLDHSSAHEQRLSGELSAAPPREGRMSCRLSSGEAARAPFFLDGSCDFSTLAGLLDVAFEGRWVGADGAIAPASFVTLRSLALAALTRYGAGLPVLAPPAELSPRPTCAGEPSVLGVVKRGSLSLVLHARRFDCPPPDADGLPVQTLALALSVFDESRGAPVLRSNLPLATPFADMFDIVDWSAGMTAFPLAQSVLGLAVSATATISGSGLITSTLEHVLAFDAHGKLLPLLTFEAGDFGKSNIENYSSSTTELFRVGPFGAVPALVAIRKHGFNAVEGREETTAELPEVYRFIPSSMKLERQRGPLSAAGWRRAVPIAASPFESVLPAP